VNVPEGTTLLLGGVRSGKSDLAVGIAGRWPGAVTVVATAMATDDEMEARIERHRTDRPASWTTIEAPHDVLGAVATLDPDRLVIVDCITLWVAALLTAGAGEDDVAGAADALAVALANRPSPSVVVSNEVGLGVHPTTAVGRVFRDTLGRANQRLAARANRTLLMVAGRVVELRAIDGSSW
jgi:adenosyl cobinamide kinase/adenosyl cobinamide phosphate guanylyltransferase